jgi:acetyltransferase-like isoleucine patch superfamily enzyme
MSYREQHKKRLSWMPWLYHSLKPELRQWVRDWQAEVQAELMRLEAVSIGADCWIGANVGVTDGVTIGDHAIIGMGSIVTRDIPAWAIAAGNPARVIGDRRDRAAD